MEEQSSKPIEGLQYVDPQVDELLRHTIRTQLESLLKSKLTTDQRQQALQKSFVDAMTLVLSKTQIKHILLVIKQ